ncbi:MAG: Polyphenol oxidase [Candidatus Tokpelaia sp. JSC189]|nr:MAG: Polyphenol oxidase [Candidatus Tokpelaia sp. JSC189]
MIDTPQSILAPNLSALQENNIFHHFFTREGGVSKGIYKSLNISLGSNDVREDILENRRKITDILGVPEKRLVTVYQVHSADVATVTAPFTGECPKADAMVTNTTGLALGISTADCGPVLFADAQGGVIGAAHSGWRGALDGVLDNTVAAMQKLGARKEKIVAVLGPCISFRYYEVGEEFHKIFHDKDLIYRKYFTSSQKNGHYYFNLSSFITDKLRKLGIARADSLNMCTYADEKRFFSYRRKMHWYEPDYGCQMSTIILRKQE